MLATTSNAADDHASDIADGIAKMKIAARKALESDEITHLTAEVKRKRQKPSFPSSSPLVVSGALLCRFLCITS
jgi:hypothetical protein